MHKQVVLSEKEYEYIENKLEDYEKLKILLSGLEHIEKEFDAFRSMVSKVFSEDENGELVYRETGKYSSNYLFLNEDILAELFNLFYRERFFEESGLTVDKYWKFS